MAGVITALKMQKRKRNRVSVFLDGGYRFAVASILTAGLKVGQALTDEEIEDLVLRDREEQAYQRALRLISRRPRSEHELRIYFQLRNVSTAVVNAVLVKLRARALLDDRAFAEAWVENRRQFRPRSALALQVELHRKGISREIIKDVLAAHDDDQAAYEAAVHGARRWRDLDYDDFTKRLSAYLSRRGFNYQTVTTAVAKVWRESLDPDVESEDEK